MKAKSLSLLLLIAMMTTACGSSSNHNSSSQDFDDIPDISFDASGDNFKDQLPKATSDGAILHCFNWTFKQIEENLQVIADAGFKSVQTSPVQQPKGNGASWWAYYQPVSFSIADNSMLGTKDDLKSLCDKAETLGVSVIADIVFNHLANVSETALEDDGTPSVSVDVKKYEPEIYQHRNDKDNPTFHHYGGGSDSGDVTQVYPYGNLPDLNTSNKLVQKRALDLLKECIDVGIDGFRFDAAKHIETPTDPEYASDFWPATLGVAKTYYKEKTGNDLFAYGEILNDVEGLRTIDDYIPFMDVTDSGYIGSQLTKFIGAQAEALASVSYSKKCDAKHLVTWVESHDTYVEDSAPQKLTRMRKMWSVLASRKDSRGLFLARPDKGQTVGRIADYMFEDEVMASANRFHNRFVGADENQIGQGKFYINERFDEKQSGALIVALGKDKAFTSDKLTHLKDGAYFDQISGQQVNVVGGRCKFEISSSGVAILTTSKNVPHPQIKLDVREGGFVDKKEIEVEAINASEAYYTINGGNKTTFTGKTKIVIEAKHADKDKLVKVEIVAKNGEFETSRHGTYKKIDMIEGGFNVVNFNPDNFTNYEVYLWTWVDNSWSKWSQNYQIKGTTLLVDVTGLDGFLIGLFPKGHKIDAVTAWDSAIIKQSSDIKGSVLQQGFFDASGF